MFDYLSAAESLSPSLCALRERIHRCPEPGNREFRTAALVEETLHGLGMETVRLTETAVVGVLKGSLPGPSAAFRADMDALPIQEATGAPFASTQPGFMHACGHDVHTSAALGAATLLSSRREVLHGSVTFLFQPDEENDGGAARMVAAGALNGVDAVFGAHVDPNLPLGTIGVRYGKFYAASNVFRITVTGRSAHGATPEKGIDALGAAALLVCRLKQLPSRYEERCVLTVGQFQSGTAVNILPGTASLAGILRTLGPDMRKEMIEQIRAVCDLTAQETGTEILADIRGSYPGVVNHNEEVALAEAAAAELIGSERVIRIEQPTMTTEDFGFFLENAGGCFYHIGVGGAYPLHNEHFLPPAEAVPFAAAVHAAVLETYLTAHS